MNVVALVGRATRDPDIRQSQGEKPTTVARYTLAVNRRDQADFISMVSFGKTAEFIEKYVHKGTKICVRGRIQTGSYTNKDNVKVYTTDVIGEEVEFAESKKSQGEAPADDDGFVSMAEGLPEADDFVEPDEKLPFA